MRHTNLDRTMLLMRTIPASFPQLRGMLLVAAIALLVVFAGFRHDSSWDHAAGGIAFNQTTWGLPFSPWLVVARNGRGPLDGVAWNPAQFQFTLRSWSWLCLSASVIAFIIYVKMRPSTSVPIGVIRGQTNDLQL